MVGCHLHISLDFPLLPIRPSVSLLKSIAARPLRIGRRVPPGFMFVRADDGSRWLIQIHGG